MTQHDDQNVSQKRDESSTEQGGGSTSSNLNDLVGKSRQATQEADEALKKAGQGGQPGGQPVQQKAQGAAQQNTANQDAKPKDDIANPDNAQGSSSDGDSAS